MGIAALITWLSTAGGGLYLLAVWLIEYDREFQAAAQTRLPIPVISAHALLAVTGLVLWAAYLFTDSAMLARAALAVLGGVVALGLTMAWRWLRVYRADGRHLASQPAGAGTLARDGRGARPSAWDPAPGPRPAGPDTRSAAGLAVPPERNFPVTVVIAHGVLAAVTVTLVAVTVLGGS